MNDLKWIRRELFGAGVSNVPAQLAEIKQGRRVKVYNARDKKDDWYLLVRLLDVNARLLSRATAVWLAVQDNREYRGDEPVPPSTPSTRSQRKENRDGERTEPKVGEGEDIQMSESEDTDVRKGKMATVCEKSPAGKTAKPKVRVLKEAWRQVVRTPESAFYERLDACIPDDVRWGLPKWVCGTDLGANEVRLWEETNPPATVSHYLDDFRHLRLSLPREPLAHPPPVSRPSTPTPSPSAGAGASARDNVPFTTVPVVLANPTPSLTPRPLSPSTRRSPGRSLVVHSSPTVSAVTCGLWWTM